MPCIASPLKEGENMSSGNAAWHATRSMLDASLAWQHLKNNTQDGTPCITSAGSVVVIILINIDKAHTGRNHSAIGGGRREGVLRSGMFCGKRSVNGLKQTVEQKLDFDRSSEWDQRGGT